LKKRLKGVLKDFYIWDKLTKGNIMKFTIITFLILSVIGYIGMTYLSQPIALDFDEKIDPYDEPQQSEFIDIETINIEKGKTKVQAIPAALYRITGRVLSRKKYKREWTGKISPLDVAMGWGTISDQELSDCVAFDQWGRYYFYTIDRNCPVNYKYLATHSANIHIIPATKNLTKALKYIKEDEIIQLRGFLVDIKGEHKGRKVWWDTSMVRDDDGNGSCEILYLVRLVIGDKSYI